MQVYLCGFSLHSVNKYFISVVGNLKATHTNIYLIFYNYFIIFILF